MIPLEWRYDDGGRAAGGFRGDTGDCVVRAVCIAGQLDYRSVYEALRSTMQANPHLVSRGQASPRHGTPPPLIKWLLNHELGWAWTPTMGIGTGCHTHLAQGEIPMTGRLVARVSRHLCAVIDGVVHDSHDPGRDGTRCVYGYWTAS